MWYKKLGIALLFLFFFEGMMVAQETKINGLIVIDFKNEHPEGVMVINRQTNFFVETDITGSFKISATVGDTLYFKGDFLEPRKLAVKKSHFNYDPLIVHMNQEIITLEEMVVRPPLTGELDKDINSVKRKEDVERVYANLGIDIRTLDLDPKEKREKILPSIIPTTLNVGALVKTINGDYRRLETLYEFEEFDEKLKKIEAYFGSKFFENEIGVSAENAREFLLFIYGKNKSTFNIAYSQRDFLSIDQLMRLYAQEFKQRVKQRNDSIQEIQSKK